MMRRAKVERKTTETQIALVVNLDGAGGRKIDTPVPFFNHMLEAVARHGLYDLELTANGDIEVDPHHLVEDVGIVLGQAFREALGDKSGIARFGHALVPMDETLVQAAVDFSGRAAFVYLADQIKGKTIGTTAWPKRVMPLLSPSASRKACPSTMPTSSTRWCGSTSTSPLALISRS